MKKEQPYYQLMDKLVKERDQLKADNKKLIEQAEVLYAKICDAEILLGRKILHIRTNSANGELIGVDGE